MRSEEEPLVRGAAPPPVKGRGGRGGKGPVRGPGGPGRGVSAGGARSTGQRGAPAGGDGAGLVLRQVDLNELAIEEHIQREKLEGAREIEQGAREIKETQEQLNALVGEQGQGITIMEKNVERATDKVQSGNDQLKGASKEQKKSRKLMCVLAVVMTVIIAVVVVIVLVMKK